MTTDADEGRRQAEAMKLLDFLVGVMRNKRNGMALQLNAAKAAAPYMLAVAKEYVAADTGRKLPQKAKSGRKR